MTYVPLKVENVEISKGGYRYQGGYDTIKVNRRTRPKIQVLYQSKSKTYLYRYLYLKMHKISKKLFT